MFFYWDYSEDYFEQNLKKGSSILSTKKFNHFQTHYIFKHFTCTDMNLKKIIISIFNSSESKMSSLQKALRFQYYNS